MRGTEKETPLPLVQIGLGSVGQALLGLIEGREGDEFLHVGFADSDGLLLDEEGFAPAELRELRQLKEEDGSLRDFPRGQFTQLEGLEDFFIAFAGRSGALLDLSDGEGLFPYYMSSARADWSVVLANKKPLAEASYEQFCSLKNLGLKYEATVGAGLPVIKTLERLRQGGEAIREIRGIMSGSLAFIFNRLEDGLSLKEAVEEARERGYTEPDPREDLSGGDVARKALILARSLGGDWELSDIRLEPLLPSDETIDLEEQLLRLGPSLRGRVEQAREDGKRLRYLARVGDGPPRVGLGEVDRDSQLARSSGTANVFSFSTDNYRQPQLTIQGPGAGPVVTAGGVLADLAELV